jgi:hypothetical protein
MSKQSGKKEKKTTKKSGFLPGSPQKGIKRTKLTT